MEIAMRRSSAIDRDGIIDGGMYIAMEVRLVRDVRWLFWPQASEGQCTVLALA
jgi:hypothetical protein